MTPLSIGFINYLLLSLHS